MNNLNREAVADALRAAGHCEANADRTGFMVFKPDAGARIVVIHCLDEHAEGHWDSPAHHDAQASATDKYRQVLEAAGLAVTVHSTGESLTVTGFAKAA